MPQPAGKRILTEATGAALINGLTLPSGSVTQASTGTMTAGALNLLNAATAGFIATLPTPTRIGQLLVAERVDTSTNLIAFGGTVRGVPAVANLPGMGVAGESFLFVAESLTSWRIAATHKPKALLDLSFTPPPVSPTTSRGIATVVEPVGNSSYSYGCRIRPIERRRLLRVVNIGVNPFRLGYSTAADNAGVNSPAYPFTVAAGQEFIDTSGNPRAMFLSDANSSSGQLLNALVITETYV